MNGDGKISILFSKINLNTFFSPFFILLLQPLLPVNSSVLSSRHNQVYQALAKLIHWADKIVLYGSSSMDKGEGSVITDEVKTGIKELVEMYIEKLKARERRMSGDLTMTTPPISKSPEIAKE